MNECSTYKYRQTLISSQTASRFAVVHGQAAGDRILDRLPLTGPELARSSLSIDYSVPRWRCRAEIKTN